MYREGICQLAIMLQAFNGVKALIMSAIFTDEALGPKIWPALQYEGPAGVGERQTSPERFGLLNAAFNAC